ncbi:MAG: hypothetical protein Q3X95_08520, partial [Duodenibacillus sp.]|nr:hypothetical protein [Duodenibacillus sp.]
LPHPFNFPLILPMFSIENAGRQRSKIAAGRKKFPFVFNVLEALKESCGARAKSFSQFVAFV